MTGLSELTPGEWDWLQQTIRHSVSRRRAALNEEGHDLATEASPPAELNTLTQR